MRSNAPRRKGRPWDNIICLSQSEDSFHHHWQAVFNPNLALQGEMMHAHRDYFLEGRISTRLFSDVNCQETTKSGFYSLSWCSLCSFPRGINNYGCAYSCVDRAEERAARDRRRSSRRLPCRSRLSWGTCSGDAAKTRLDETLYNLTW